MEEHNEQVVKITLPRLYKLQQEIVSDTARFKVICAGRRVGKTVMVCHVSITSMISKLRVCYITPTFTLADEMFDNMLSKIPQQLITKSHKTNRVIELITGGTIRFFSGEALNRTRGFEYDLVIIDEAAQIPELLKEWNASLRPLLIKTKGKAYFISTPLGKNDFYSLFGFGQSEINGYKSWKFSSYENPHLPVDELNLMIAELPTAVYQQEILAEPMANAANPFGTDNINANIIQELSTDETVCYAVDVASVKDWTVVTGLDKDGRLSYFDRFQLPWPMTKLKLEALALSTSKLVVIDGTGVGSVLVAEMQLTCSNVEAFIFTTESKPKLIFELIKSVEKGQLKYNQIIADEMHTYQFKYSATGHISFNAQSGFHDDAICSIAMCNKFRHQAIATSVWKLYSA